MAQTFGRLGGVLIPWDAAVANSLVDGLLHCEVLAGMGFTHVYDAVLSKKCAAHKDSAQYGQCFFHTLQEERIFYCDISGFKGCFVYYGFFISAPGEYTLVLFVMHGYL